MDIFAKNILLVFLGTSLANFLNLLYQLLLAHRLSVTDFANFNALLSIYVLISTPLTTLQAAVSKYSAGFSARGELSKIKFLLSGVLRRALMMALITFVIFYFASFSITDKLKIPSLSCGYILAFLLALSWITPVVAGGLQGLELFKWFTGSSIVSGILKLLFAFVFILLGYNIAGALGALLISGLLGLAISYLPLRSFISLKVIDGSINYQEIFFYLFPVAISSFCFMGLVNLDMILVKYFFSSENSGLYSLAQMLGKIFLFLPGAISIVMFPKTSGLNAKSLDTRATLKRSLFYAFILCLLAGLAYNFFPGFSLRILTGKSYSESIVLGRLFSLSMSFFALLFILINYFLSIKDLRFIKYLALFTIFQFLAIVFIHPGLIQVQVILCINAMLLFFIHLWLAYR